MRRGLAILGATGSVGSKAVEVAAAFPELFSVEVVTCRRQGERLRERAVQCGARELYCAEGPQASTLADEEALLDLLVSPRVDVVLCAIQGDVALRQVLAALQAGKTVALATKEVLVAAGQWVMETAARHGGRILPVDSEHCAIFQCLQGHAQSDVQALLLTCSGGPFHQHPELDLEAVTPAQALAHPVWQMGEKISLDCATLMNKAFEIIEAACLFGIEEERIQVLIHPQAIIHSMVSFRDGSVLAQMGPQDMRLPIQYCLTWPARKPPMMQAFSLQPPLRLDLLPPDEGRFPALRLARQACRRGGLAGAVLNAANDFACRRFLDGTLPFGGIARAAAAALEHVPAGEATSYEALAHAREVAQNIVSRFG